MNEKYAEFDHAKVREGIIAWVRSTGMRAFLVPEMSYAVPVGLSEWLFEIDQVTGAQIAECMTRIGKDLPAARLIAAEAGETARRAMAAMIALI